MGSSLFYLWWLPGSGGSNKPLFLCVFIWKQLKTNSRTHPLLPHKSLRSQLKLQLPDRSFQIKSHEGGGRGAVDRVQMINNLSAGSWWGLVPSFGFDSWSQRWATGQKGQWQLLFSRTSLRNKKKKMEQREQSCLYCKMSNKERM